MLAKKHRLPKETGSKKFFTFPASFFNVKIGKNNKEESRFAFIVSKNIDKRATVRNRIKRQFRRFIEENYSKIKLGHDFLFKIKKEAKNKKTTEIHKEIKGFLEKESLIE